MILRFLDFERDHRQEKLNGEKLVYCKGFHIAQMYLYFLGKKFILDGSEKITVFVKYKKEDEEKYVNFDYFGVSWYYLENEEIDAYLNAKSNEEADLILCGYLRNTLLDIARKNECSREIIDKINYAYDMVVRNNFTLSYEISKLSKTNRTLGYRALVFRNMNRDIGEVWSVKVIDKKNNDKVVYEEYLNKPPSYIYGSYCYRSSRWEDNCFVLFNDEKKVQTSLKF